VPPKPLTCIPAAYAEMRIHSRNSFESASRTYYNTQEITLFIKENFSKVKWDILFNIFCVLFFHVVQFRAFNFLCARSHTEFNRVPKCAGKTSRSACYLFPCVCVVYVQRTKSVAGRTFPLWHIFRPFARARSSHIGGNRTDALS
jgi:hypothetical protein